MLTDKNSGFKHSDSTVNQLLFITQKIENTLDDKHDACIVFLDVSKAFDKVWHKHVLFKTRKGDPEFRGPALVCLSAIDKKISVSVFLMDQNPK